MFKNLNSQAALGQGYTNNSSAYRDTGATNAKGMTYGTTGASTANDTVKFLGMEDFYGNLCQWVDGYLSGSGISKIADGNFNDTGNGYESHARTGEVNYTYIKDVVADNALAFTPMTGGASTSTYFCDYGYIRNSAYLPYFGGTRSYGAYAGAFFFDCNSSASSAYPDIGARLAFYG